MSPVKFQFNSSFGEEEKRAEEEQIAKLQARIDQARQEGRTAGLEEGRKRTLEEIEAQTARSLDQIAAQAKQLFQQHHDLQSELQSEAAELAYGIASKLAPALIERTPMAEIEALVSECMETCQKEPRLVVRVADDLADSLAGKVEHMKLANGFTGDVIILGDPTLSGTDCRVEWPDGGAERSVNQVHEVVGDAVQRYLAADNSDDAPADSAEQAAAGGPQS